MRAFINYCSKSNNFILIKFYSISHLVFNKDTKKIRHNILNLTLEDVQLKTFDGLQSMLAVLTVAMYIIYKKIRALHFSLLLDAGYNYLNKNIPRELTNFIYYKISKVVSILLMPTRSRPLVCKSPPIEQTGQLNLVLN